MILKKYRHLPSLFLLCCCTLGFGQNDTIPVLKLGDFLSLVASHHPVVKQSQLVVSEAEAGLQVARGGFDPKVSLDYDLKNLKETEYWDIFNATLKVPTVLGIEPKIAVDRAEGEHLNEERYISSSTDYQQVAAGLTIPIGKGLLIDERRATLQQAKIYQDIAGAEQNKMVNKVLLKAIKSYWEWYLSYAELDLLQESIDIAEEIYRRVMLDFDYGEVTVLDTIQAKISLQSRQADYEKVKFQFINSRLMLNLFLWTPEGQPLELKANTVPDSLAYSLGIPSEAEVNEMVLWASTQHPELLKLTNKVNQLQVENRLNREYLKPKIDLSYSFIDAPFSYGEEANDFSFSDNYKLGVDFSFPLLLRKERGKIRKTDFKISSANFDLANQKLTIQNNILSKYAETQMSQRLAQQYLSMSRNYERLVEGEAINLENGESDLFKFNIQLNKFIESQIKYLENLVKLQKNRSELLYESGSLYQTIQ